jgi:hypothetical protein
LESSLNLHAYALRGPSTESAATPSRRDDRVTCFFLTLPLIAGIFLSRFALPLFHSQLALPLLVIVASIVGLAAIGRLRVHLPRLILFTVTIAAMMTAAVLGGAGQVSATSFVLMAVLYLGYVFVVDGDEVTYASVIAAFRRIYLIVAIAGIAQFLGQIVVRGPTLFTFRGFIPDAFLALEYNYVDPTDFLPGFLQEQWVLFARAIDFWSVDGLGVDH